MNIIKLIKLGLLRFRSEEDYRAMQSYIANATVADLEKRGCVFSESSVLELGAGRGGYSLIFHKNSRNFIASDLEENSIFEKFNIPFQKVNVLQSFPFESNSFDLIYCSSLIEHLADPSAMLRESRRVLKPRGVLFISFPPFYSLSMVGGHHFKPFHFLGERLAVRLTNFFRKSDIQDYATCYGGFGLHPLNIDDVKLLILNNGFEITDIYTRMSSINTARWPGILKDLATWHVCYLVRKPL